MLPRLPTMPGKADWGKVTPRSVPAAASVGTGAWVEWDVPWGRSTGTAVAMPPGAGYPLLADWNGNGVATPGRYENGEWLITNATVDSPGWEGYASYGGDPRDIPVVGRYDKDKRADIGVFRDGEWHWQRANGKPAAVDIFGTAGDVPVVGDWDGDGRDDIGVVRGGQWILRVTGLKNKKAAKALAGKGITVTKAQPEGTFVLTFRFGSNADLPVVGDWDRDGRDEPGIVRNRSVWVLSGGLGHLRRTSKQTHRLDGRPGPVGRQPGHRPGPLPHCHARRREERAGRSSARHQAEDPPRPAYCSRQPGGAGDGAGRPALRRDERSHQAPAGAGRDALLRPAEHAPVDRGVGAAVSQLRAVGCDRADHVVMADRQRDLGAGPDRLCPLAHPVPGLPARCDLPGRLGQHLAVSAVGGHGRAGRLDALARAQ